MTPTPEKPSERRERDGPGMTAGLSLRERDRLFLHEHVQFGLMHHVVVAEALRSAYERSDETATAMRVQIERTTAEEAARVASELNDGARVQTIVVARLLSEFAATIEDLGALMHAIRHRRRRGVLVEYLEASVPAVADMLDLLLDRGASDFPGVLHLPDLAGLEGRLHPEAVAALRHDYENLGVHLVQVGAMYRETGPAGVTTTAADVPTDQLAVVLAVEAPGEQVPERRGGLLPRVHNKLKHRFAVLEDISRFEQAGGELTFAHYPRDPAHAKRLIHNITQVALLGAELASIVLAVEGDHPLARRGLDATGSPEGGREE